MSSVCIFAHLRFFSYLFNLAHVVASYRQMKYLRKAFKHDVHFAFDCITARRKYYKSVAKQKITLEDFVL